MVGDIHGAYDLVVAALKQAKFHPDRDRLIGVGDTHDRGPQSYRSAAFLQQGYVFEVRGNHEDMLLDLYSGEPPSEEVLRFMCQFNGMGLWLELSEDQRQEMLASIRQLPLVIEIETARGTVGVVHADVPADQTWPEFLERVQNLDSETIKVALWGRDRIKSRSNAGVTGVGRVFVGHTPQWNGVTRYGNVYAIDTGAIYGQLNAKEAGHLTVARVSTNTGILSQPPKVHDLINLCDFDDESQEPFGQYAQAPALT